MADQSSIEWTDATWNPVTGCSKVSPGCKNCYAIPETNRHRNLPKYAGLVRDMEWTGEVRCHPELLAQPMAWREPRRIFVNSMADTFHSRVPWDFIAGMFDAMAACPWHTFQVLTKRPGNMAAFAEWWCDLRCLEWPAHIWAGTSLEMEWDGKKRLTGRLDCLARVPAPVLFVSVEPMLGPLNLTKWLGAGSQCEADRVLNWVICGGESGPRARPMHPDWPRGLRDQCQAAGVPFFFKQAIIDGKRVSLPELDGRQWQEMPDGHKGT